MKEIALLFIFMGPVAIIAQTLEITNGPMDTTVCTGSIVNIPCGFVNLSNVIVPNWRIIRRSNNGSVIINVTISGTDINNNVNDGLEYIPDTTSGPLMSPNSRLVVGPVDETDNQSSYQCSFALAGGNVESNVGTLTVTGPPSPISDFNVSEICNTTISGVSWTPSSGDPVCGPVSHELTISPNDTMIMMMRITNTSYDITGLTPNTSYNLTVISSNMAGSVEYVMMISTPSTNDSVPSAVTNLINTTYNEDNITVIWDAASSPYCGGVLYYIVMISSDEHSNIMNDMMNITLLTATFHNLMNDTNYIITVTPYNRVVAGMSTTVSIRTSSPVPTQSNNPTNNPTNNSTNPSSKPTPTPGGGGSSNTAIIVIIVVIIVKVCVAVIASFIATYLYDKIVSDDGGNTLTKTKILMWVFIVLSLGLGLIFIGIYVCCGGKKGAMCCCEKKSKDVQPFEEEMDHHDKSSDLYDSPKNKQLQDDPQKSGAQEQSLYSYARSGPINVVMPVGQGGKP